ncbi:MAG TPA: hypothetical protein DCY13_18910 [Verrucomicrobiales bacterium]|nr:hypothetical protein [Verrucomicrobiales bacterium]
MKGVVIDRQVLKDTVLDAVADALLDQLDHAMDDLLRLSTVTMPRVIPITVMLVPRNEGGDGLARLELHVERRYPSRPRTALTIEAREGAGPCGRTEFILRREFNGAPLQRPVCPDLSPPLPSIET